MLMLEAADATNGLVDGGIGGRIIKQMDVVAVLLKVGTLGADHILEDKNARTTARVIEVCGVLMSFLWGHIGMYRDNRDILVKTIFWNFKTSQKNVEAYQMFTAFSSLVHTQLVHAPASVWVTCYAPVRLPSSFFSSFGLCTYSLTSQV
ncbi:hypothetical protein TMatcc_000858 [Talaromyces marneffei ATCC 18224]|uniref:Uncharacterized protein n=1 Tax=Talaromyces marneffei PM1 TaxID=1077442 RepID=A0A093V587_TALMA|nr:uncharacterized protein EYB26_003404 [Talaromyces marneffei]KAE8549818.1 hypothetical protein EYB25_008342 [Talaromyces marneffei]QGA15744.1 hypothetical protein EYB26_003404 [Talaromyces marneffei]